ncbi:coiled-coil domain-containing protein 30 [Protobothrops mucrosquamatus]|uniref:coiled-coil domain-containing protein 30 n=1 Tax=Protobothrops mucrosquamatus TaxID=103944 RepID=UPI000775E01D|nr:coiled-coil domain-containing protein 30 [Protobothrops mucrosquamatus]
MEGGRLLGEAEGGGDAAGTPSETQLAHPWPCFLPGQEELRFASEPSLRQQLEKEMREVQNYVDHVRALTEARDALAAEYERENEELRAKFAQLQLELESQHKEVAELLALEGLTGIVHSSPSEQVAYLLVERSTLLERMAGLEEELGAPLCLGRPCAAALQELHLYRSELLRLHGELQGFQGAAEERDFLRLAHQKLLQKNGLLEAKGPPHKGALQPQEEPPGLCGDPRQAPISGGSVKKQLRLEQERSLELRLQNLQLQQENIKVQAELRQAQARLSESSKACGALASQGELCQQTVKELEMELLQQSQAAKQQSRLREQLSQEGQRAAQAEKRAQDLEQRLQEARQLQEGQAALGRRQLEEEAREARAKEADARRSLQEEQKRRKALEQKQEEQQQQRLRLWREKEAGLLQALADREAQAQQQEGHLRALEEERRALAKEHLRCQSRSQRLSEQLSALRQEKEALCDEQRQILKQVDVSLRKQSERRLRHKARLRQAKETLLGEVKLRDTRIRNLENEVRLSKSQAEKDQLLIRRVTSENEGLFREKRKTLEQLHSLEEAKQSDGQALCALQNRVQLLEGENKQLQDRTLQLSLQVGILERALRTIHVHSLEELKSLGFPECPLQRKLLPFPGFSFSVTRLSDASSLRQAIKGGQPAEPGQKALLSPLAFRSSRVGCLGVPRNPADLRQDEPGQPAC